MIVVTEFALRVTVAPEMTFATGVISFKSSDAEVRYAALHATFPPDRSSVTVCVEALWLTSVIAVSFPCLYALVYTPVVGFVVAPTRVQPGRINLLNCPIT
jgi:hypothetical protein